MAKLTRIFGKLIDSETIKTFLTFKGVRTLKREDRSHKVNTAIFFTHQFSGFGLQTSGFEPERTISFAITSFIAFSIVEYSGTAFPLWITINAI
jgi:hypothetical protein